MNEETSDPADMRTEAGCTCVPVLILLACACVCCGQRAYSETHAPTDVSALFPGLAGLRAAQASRLRDLLISMRKQQHETGHRDTSGAHQLTQQQDTRAHALPAGSLRPAPAAHADENKAITNPPYTNRRPSEETTTRTGLAETNQDGEDRWAEPSLETGPDDAELTQQEWLRAVRTVSDMCARYEAAETRRVAAIPLVPTPTAVSVRVSTCARSTPLVVGGEAVSIEEHPHMSALGWPRVGAGGGFAWKCGGSLVSESFVLTAAHCAYQDRDTTVLSGPPRVVRLGSSRLDDSDGVLVRVRRAVRHPRYRAPASYYDIALLQLTQTVTFSAHVRPACIGDQPSPRTSVIATGWGRTEYGGEMSEVLRGVSLSVLSSNECKQALGTSRKLPRGPDSNSQLCAGELRGGKDTCQGDSGGPLVTRTSTAAPGKAVGCVWRVVGVTSLGRACGAARSPALYALPLPAFVASVVWPSSS